jgi:hypothetical protein
MELFKVILDNTADVITPLNEETKMMIGIQHSAPVHKMQPTITKIKAFTTQLKQRHFS